MRAALLAIALLVPLLPARAAAQDLVADLSSHLIAINTGFVGTDVVLFGAIDRPGDVVVVVRGPDQEAVVRRRGRVAGLWLNVQSAEFADVPAFYVVAASEPIEDIVTAPERARHQIGLADLRLEPEAGLPPEQRTVFRDALIRNKQELGVYGTAVGQVSFLGERLFRTNVYFPANVATGLYTVSAYLVRDGQVVSAQTTPLVVSKVGFSAEIFEFAQRESLYYGLLAVVGAVMAGWLAAAAFRRG
jgi:uncharacterized protein (TIGR02186 family)